MKKIFSVLACFILSVSFVGCGEEGGPSSQAQESAQWKTRGFAISQEEGEEQGLNILRYLPCDHETVYNAGEEGNGSLLDSGVCGELVWWLHRVTDSEKQEELALEIQNVTTGECTVKRFSYEQLGLEDTGGRLRAMDMIDKDHYVFQWVETENDDEGFTIRRTLDKRIYTDSEGEVLHTMDLCPSYRESGLEYVLLSDGNCDGRGNTYVLASRENGRAYTDVCFFDRDGNRILEYRGEQFRTVGEPLRTPEGELIFPVWDSQERQTEYLWADMENGEMKSLAVEKEDSNSVFQLYGMQGNDIYYNRSNKEIVKWNIESGERTKILDLPGNGLAVYVELRMVFGKEGDFPVLYVEDSNYGKEWLAALTDQEVTDRETIRVADMVKSMDNTKNAVGDSVSIVSGINREVFYTYERADTEESRIRLLADLSSGQGPDILYVSLEDMRMLEEKGLLMDLRELIPETLQNEMLPGALEIGTVGGKLAGIPVSVTAETLMVSRDTWPEDSWSLEDIIGLMESGALEGGIYYHDSYYYPLATMKILLRYSLADSFLIDWENRESHFDDERFVRLLELTYENRNDGQVEMDTRLKGGKRMAWIDVGRIQNDLCFDADRERENGYYIGYPTSDGSSGNYLFTEGVIVVNAASKNKEAVSAFLEVLSDGQALGNDTGVLGEKPRIVMDEATGKLLWIGREEICVFPDNTTSIDRANDFLKSCKAAPPTYPPLLNIIEEELISMYDLNREPEETAELIDNRVQLYLDEEG